MTQPRKPLTDFVDPPRQQRPHAIQIRLTESEREMVDELAEHMSISRSELIRALFRREAARVAKEKGYE